MPSNFNQNQKRKRKAENCKILYNAKIPFGNLDPLQKRENIFDGLLFVCGRGFYGLVQRGLIHDGSK
jgi:hypothetical protein